MRLKGKGLACDTTDHEFVPLQFVLWDALVSSVHGSSAWRKSALWELNQVPADFV